MGSVMFLCLTLSFLVVLVHSYEGRGFNRPGEFFEARSSEKSVKDVAEDASIDHLPVYVGSQGGLKGKDRISMLPGQPMVNFDQYSGYITVDPKAGRALFYWLNEAEDSSNKPLVLWLNGGPGCSSIGNGAMTELGPFRVNPDGKTLWYNKFSWNTVANILFLESPAGVGFSYSNTTSDYITGDKRTAADSYTFLLNWLERFPEYKSRYFYITGESYAGHYAPQLADLILRNNKISNQTVINLKGIAIGNGYIDFTDQRKGIYDYLWTSALITDEVHEGIVRNCDFSSRSSESDTCNAYIDQAYRASGDVFPYEIYAPFCLSTSNPPSFFGFDPCSGRYVFNYLNSPEVQRALHANVTGAPGPWGSCSNVVHSNWHWQDPDTVLPLIRELMATDIRIWIFSGDLDSVVPAKATRYSMAKLGSPVKTPWHAWYSRGEVGGYVVEYQNVTFVTVRGAGHFVPSYQPERALALFTSFLEGKLPPGRS